MAILLDKCSPTRRRDRECGCPWVSMCMCIDVWYKCVGGIKIMFKTGSNILIIINWRKRATLGKSALKWDENSGWEIIDNEIA